MGVLLVGEKVFENDLVVVYEVRTGDNEPLEDTIVISRHSPENWGAFVGIERYTERIYYRAWKHHNDTGEWPNKVGLQS